MRKLRRHFWQRGTKPDSAARRARRYLLGELRDEECRALEEEYFGGGPAQELVAAAEDELIEDYIDGALPEAERTQFERVYLSSAGHRLRVDTVRHLRETASALSTTCSHARGRTFRGRWPLTAANAAALAPAAVIVLALLGTIYVLRSSLGSPRPGSGQPTLTAANTPRPPARSAPSPHVFVFELRSVTPRGRDEGTALVIPPGTEIVSLRFQVDPGARGLARGLVTTLAGDRVWEGRATLSKTPGGMVVQFDVPAAQLDPNDYIITFTTVNGEPQERDRRPLHVRAP